MGESFLRNDKSQIKLLSQFYPNLHSPFMTDSNSKIITHRVLKIHNGYKVEIHKWI